MSEFNFGFFKEPSKKKEEKYDFAFLKLVAKDTTKTKTYSKFELSIKAKKLLNLKNATNQVIGYGNLDKDTLLLVNTTSYKLPSDSNNCLISKTGNFSNTPLYDKLIKLHSLDCSKDNYLKLTSLDNISFTNKKDQSNFNASAVRIELMLNDTTKSIETKPVEEVEEITTTLKDSVQKDSFEDLPDFE